MKKQSNPMPPNASRPAPPPAPPRKQKPQTGAQRFNKHSDGKKAAGLVRLPTRWVHPDDKDPILDHIEQKNKARSIV